MTLPIAHYRYCNQWDTMHAYGSGSTCDHGALNAFGVLACKPRSAYHIAGNFGEH